MSKYDWEKLSPEELDKCAEAASWLALRHAAQLLTPERLDWCAEKDPLVALMYAAPLLTQDRKAWIIRKNPVEAMKIMAKDKAKHLMEETNEQV